MKASTKATIYYFTAGTVSAILCWQLEGPSWAVSWIIATTFGVVLGMLLTKIPKKGGKK